MNITQSTAQRAKRLLPKASDGPPAFERRQMQYILDRMNGKAGFPFPDGTEVDPADERHLVQRLGELCREVERRAQIGQYA